MRIASLLPPFVVVVGLPLCCGPLSAQEGTAATPGISSAAADDLGLTAAERAELDRILQLTLPQQKTRAKELIEDQPDSQLAAVLRRLLGEYKTFGRIADAEREARAARSAWNREYWRSRCCPVPVWDPPVGRIGNATDEPVLYEIRMMGLERTLWMGPYRLRAGASYASPHPYLVRYLTPVGVQEQLIGPGQSFAFQGGPGDGTLFLGPGEAGAGVVPPPGPALGDAPAPMQAPEPTAE